LLNELQETTLEAGIMEELEADYAQLVNVETILEQLSKGHQVLTNEQVGVNPMLIELKNASAKLATISPKYDNLNERIQSVFVELDDITSEIEYLQDAVEANPGLLDQINQQLQILHTLQKKHGVGTVEELISIREDLKRKVGVSENVEFEIEEKQTLLSNTEIALVELGQQLHRKRQQVAPLLKEQLEEALVPLGMPNATFKIELQYTEEFQASGMDQLVFLFSANKGTGYGPLKKVASGGELSRIMLVIKSILATYEQLPTMMFDEIDTGVSGEISNNMGDIMSKMSATMQIFSITHLPQVASKGDHHYKVYKEDDNMVTHTKMKKLNTEERIKEVAEMLGGKDLSDSAMAHARQLLN
ncbi:MAG: DNA repair protein RecN, partial [Eudoraea sp.]|nr:DNA repair protein RecN [Eudoraea sp.]